MTQIKATYIDHMGTDLSVVNSARVSFGKSSKFEEALSGRFLSTKDTKLIYYLAKHKHLSPFGHAFASFHVKAPIFVARQLVKHKFLRWNEISRRYVDEEPEFYVPDVWRGRAEDKKQGSSGEVSVHDWTFEVADHPYSGCLHDNGLYAAVLGVYKDLLDQGVAPEMARMVLPQSTMTEWYWSGSLDAFAQMCALRLKDDTQYESRLVAQQISEEMSKLYPVSWVALMENL
jgi:thymidylate synthase (FAD)